MTEIAAGTVRLRPWRAEDEEAVYLACQDEQIQRWVPVPSPYTRADARAWVTDLAPGEWGAGTGRTFAVVEAASGELVASVGLHQIKDAVCEVGYWCAPWARGRSVTSDAVAALCRWAFDELGMRRIRWVAGVGNWSSRAVAEKCGFAIDGVARDGLTVRDSSMDAWVGTLTSAEGITDRRPLPPPPVLSDGVISLRRWSLQDVHEATRAGQDPLLARFRGLPRPYTAEHAAGWIQELVFRGWAEGAAAELAITRDGALVGSVGLKLRLRRLGIAEVSYWTADWARGQGIAGRAALLISDWGLDHLGVQRIELLADVENPASQRVAEKAGFVREGVARSARRDGQGQLHDLVVFSRVCADRGASPRP